MNIVARTAISMGLALLPVQTAVPVDKEPRHHLKFANAYVRVIDAQVPVADATLFHTHSADNVPVTISGGKLKTELEGQGETFSTVETGSVRFAKASYTHRITNVGDTPLRFIDVEILASPTAAPNASKVAGAAGNDGIAGHKLVFENERVRVYQLTIPAGRRMEPHVHNLARLMVVVHGSRLILGADNAAKEFAPGEFAWHPAETAGAMKNVGKAAFEAVDIELK